MRAEEFSRFFDRHFQHIADALVVIADGKGLLVKPFAGTAVTWHPTGRQKIHLQLDCALSGTNLASASFHVKRKAAGIVSANPSLRQLREHLSNFIEYLHVSARNRA